MTDEQLANASIRNYQLERKIEGLLFDAELADSPLEALRLRNQAREIELLIGY